MRFLRSSVAWTVVAIPLVLLVGFAIAVQAGLALIYEEQADSLRRQNDMSEARAVAERIPASITRIQQDLYRLAMLGSIGLSGPEITRTQSSIARTFETLEADIFSLNHGADDPLSEYYLAYRSAAMQAAELIERSPIVGITAIRGVVPVYEKIEQAALLNSAALTEQAEENLIEVRNQWRNLMITSTVSTLILMLILTTMSFLASRLITGPILKLSNTVKELESGNINTTVPGVERQDELGQVARSVEQFRLNLIRLYSLQQERDDLNRTLEQKVRHRTAEVEEKSRQLAEAQVAAEEARQKMTAQLRSEFGLVVRAAGAGNFNEHITSTFSDPNLQSLANDINQMVDTVNTGVSAAVSAVRELASDGARPKRLEAFSGAFADMMENIDETANTIRAQSERLQHSALHDALTGLPNRRFLEKRLADAGEISSNEDQGLGFLHIDLDRFKEVNDTLGHAAGDKVLVRTAEILSDAADASDFIARVGGDEFVLVSPVKPNQGGEQTEIEKDRLQAKADKIVSKLAEPFDINGTEVRYGASIGIAYTTSSGHDPVKLMVEADIALYAAKEGGRNQSRLFTPELNSSMLDRKLLQDDLHRALEAEEFEPYFQLQVDAKTHETCGLETLVRWKHPTKGIIAPGGFLKQAEEIGLMAKIDSQVSKKAVAAAIELQNAGLNFEKLSVNVSLQRLEEPDFVESIRQLGTHPFKLSIELLETIFFDDLDTSLQFTIDALKDMGVGIEIDDFGSGRASISSLFKLRPDWLKIDQSIIRTVAADPTQVTMVSAIVDMAHALGVKVLAEGIEDLAVADLLTSVGCERFQGFYFAVPAPAHQLIPSGYLKVEQQ